MGRTRRTVLTWCTAACLCWLGACTAIGVIAADDALHPQRLPLTAADEARAEIIAAEGEASLTNVQVTANDGVILRAWILRPIHENGDAVILLHGQGDNRSGMLGNADLLLRHGFTVLLPDARAHGESGGSIATYGVEEAQDVRHWYQWLDQTMQPHCIDGLGDSMGAAELLRALAVEPGFCAVIAESTFAAFEEAAYDRLGQEFGTGPWLGRTVLRPAMDAGLIYVDLRYGVNLEEASPLKAVKESDVPVLLIHGLADTNLPARHSEMIRAAAPRVVLWEPATAEHCGAFVSDPIEYEARVVGWFEKNNRQAHGTVPR